MNNNILKKSKLWQLIWFFAKIALKLFYKKIIIEGKENIPKNCPIIFASNHQNALMDPLAILYASNRQVVFAARADMFKNKTVAKILNFLKIIPIFRMKDGKENLQKNDITFNLSIKILKNNKSICLFPEATHNDKRQLLPHKKAIPKLAFLAEEKNNFNLDIKIVPIGIYYSDYSKIGSTLYIKIGKCISVKDYKTEYYENPLTAINLLKNNLFDESRKLVIDIQNNEYYQQYTTIIEILSSNIKDIKDKIDKQKKYSLIIDYIYKNNQAEFMQMINILNERENILQKHKINSKEKIDIIQKSKIITAKILTAIIISPVFIIGVAINILPYLCLKVILWHTEDTQLYSTIKFVLGIVIFPFYPLIAVGIISIHIFYFYKSTINEIRKRVFFKKHKKEYNTVLNIEKEINEILNFSL